MRLFVSVDLPPALVDPVADLHAQLEPASGLGLTDPAQAHLTLKFLGEVDPERVPTLTRELETAVDETALEPFTARFGGLGVFPSLEYISVVWLGLEDGSEALTRLHEAIEARTTALGFDPEDHEFTPHVTLARMDHAGGKELVQEVVTESEGTVGSMTVDDIRLTESTLTSDGPVYETVERFELA